jgi:hypothetical protein
MINDALRPEDAPLVMHTAELISDTLAKHTHWQF